MYEYAAVVTKVHDGDTLGLKIDLGFHCWLGSDARLEGINAPELTTMVKKKRTPNLAGEDSTIALMNMLGRGNFAERRTRSVFGIPGDYLALPGKEPRVIVRTRMAGEGDVKDTEKYGRVLAQIRLDVKTDVTLNAAMIRGGHAVAYVL